MMKSVLAAAILALIPAISPAQGCQFGHDDQQVMSCASGMMWDVKSSTCVEIVTG